MCQQNHATVNIYTQHLLNILKNGVCVLKRVDLGVHLSEDDSTPISLEYDHNHRSIFFINYPLKILVYLLN